MAFIGQNRNCACNSVDKLLSFRISRIAHGKFNVWETWAHRTKRAGYAYFLKITRKEVLFKEEEIDM